MGVYNWLDKKLGGVLPGGKPYGSDSKPVDVNTTTATSSGDPTAIKNETPSKTKSTFQMLSYPDGLDNTAEYPHQVIINVLVRETQVEGGTGANLPSGGRGESMGANLGNDAARKVVEQFTKAVVVGGTAAYAASNLSLKSGLVAGGAVLLRDDIASAVSNLVDVNTTRKNVAQIRLAMMQSPKNVQGAEWTATDMGGILGAIMNNSGDKGISDMLKSADMGTEAGQSLLRAGAGALNLTKQMGLNLPLQASIELLSRKVANPFKETLFKTMGFRSFPFTFKFAPKNSHELLQTMKIVNVFERYMTPKKSAAALFMEYPAEFEIIYMYRGQENAYFTNFFNDTALTSFEANFGNGAMYTSFQGTDGAPSEVTLSLQFQELTLRDRDKITDITDQESVMGGFTGIDPTAQGETVAEVEAATNIEEEA